MSYELSFHPDALAECKKIDDSVRELFMKKIAEWLYHPHVSSACLLGPKDRYKIKLRDAGYRLVYEVRDKVLLVVVVAVGMRERNTVYRRDPGSQPR